MTNEPVNAIINNIDIQFSHGMLSCYVFLDYGGSGQGFGGFVLYNENFKGGINAAGNFIFRVMQIAGVEHLDDAKGRTVRVIRDHSKVYAIGHIIKDDWYYPDKEFKELKAAREAEK